MGKRTRSREVPASEVAKLLDYDPESGLLTWKVSRGRVRAGQVAGYDKGDRGYMQVGLLGYPHYVHRIAWVIQTGKDLDSEIEIDHKNGDPSDNRWSNLRLATPMQNKRNMVSNTNTSGHRGVTYRKSRNKWQAQMSLDGRCVYLGSYEKIEDAIAARDKAEAETFGEFSFKRRA